MPFILPRSSRCVLLLALLATASCTWNAAGQTGCEPAGPATPLPEVLRESSGAAWSLTHPDVLWSHNDGGNVGELFALDLEGNLLSTLTLTDTRNRDWEDMASARCGDSACLYVAEIGDNYARWDTLYLYRVPEPGALEDVAIKPDVFPMILPDGARDTEAVFVLPDEEVFLVNKGRHDTVTLYRYPPPLKAGEAVTLEAVQTFSDGALPIPDQVTGASASPDGEVVALRTYHTLTFHRWADGRLVSLEGGQVELRTLSEPQGEAVALGADGRVALTTEAGNFGGKAAMRVLRCGVGG